jgi:hypothetical protein
MSFIYCHLHFHANLIRPWPFPLKLVIVHGIFGCYICIENFAVTILKKKQFLPLNLCLCICLNEETQNRRTLLPKTTFVSFIILIWFVNNIDIDWYMYMFIELIISGNTNYNYWCVVISPLDNKKKSFTFYIQLILKYICFKKL